MQRDQPAIALPIAKASLLTVWAIGDGRPGHWNQVTGLIEAIERRTPDVHVVAFPSPSRLKSVGDLFRGRWKETDVLPTPDLIIGAGHATHLPMLIAKETRGGRAIVLMKPSLPRRMFDACLIPHAEVDPALPYCNVIPTSGAINRMQRSTSMSDDAGTILLGGPSRHVNWNQQSVIDQVFEVCSQTGDIHWHISTSRRTPAGTLAALEELGLLNVTIIDGYKTSSSWLPGQLAKSAFAWVTADSVSMVYEALTSGASVGLLDVPLRRRNGKIAQHVRGLSERGDVTLFETWQGIRTLSAPGREYAEADRCAGLLLSRFFSSEEIESRAA